jgi:hypothetical protein
MASMTGSTGDTKQPCIELPPDATATIELCRGDASAFLQLGLTFLEMSEASPTPPGRAPPPPQILHNMKMRMQTVLGYVLRHLYAPAATTCCFHSCLRSLDAVRFGTAAMMAELTPSCRWQAQKCHRCWSP